MHAHYDTRDAETTFMTDAQVLEAAAELVDEFLPFVQEVRLGEDILDCGLLPASRQALESAFRLAIATTIQPAGRRRLVSAGKRLAQFQPDVGRRISLSPASPDRPDINDASGFGARIESVLVQTERDRERLTSLFAEADAFAQRRFETYAKPPFHEDGTYTWHGHSTSH